MEILASALLRGILTILFVAICVLLITVILLQKGRGGGLSGAFGGAGGYSAFGAKTGDVFTWITIVLTAMFVLVAIAGNFVFVPDTDVPQTTQLQAPGGPGQTGAGPEQPGAGGPAGTTQPAQ
jgi:preprotein translocase subunit SecG